MYAINNISVYCLCGNFFDTTFFHNKKNKIVYNDIQKKDKKHWKLVIKILVALIISIIVGVLSFYILGIYVLIGLNAGR